MQLEMAAGAQGEQVPHGASDTPTFSGAPHDDRV